MNMMKSIWSDFDRIFEIDSSAKSSFPMDISFAGYDKKDLNIEMNRGYLNIVAENNRMGKTNYNVFITGGYSNEDIVATMDNGLLTIDVKKSKKEPKKIEIR